MENSLPAVYQGLPCRVWYKGHPGIWRVVAQTKAFVGGTKSLGTPRDSVQKLVRLLKFRFRLWPDHLRLGSPRLSPAPPPASVQDPFEETKMLLAEAMYTESVASGVDYPDSDIDELDEAVRYGSNGISDYDTSGGRSFIGGCGPFA